MALKGVEQFNKEIRAFSKTLVPAKVILFQKKIAFQVLRGVVLKTPVDTGRAKGNWQTTIGAPAEGISNKKDDTPIDTGGEVAMSQGLTAMANLGMGQVIWITNNLPYIVRLENGSSDQAPQGMMALTLAELSTQFQ